MEIQVPVKVPESELLKAVETFAAKNKLKFSTKEEKEHGWFNATDAAAYMGISKHIFYKWLNQGKITFSMIDGIKRYSKKELDRVLIDHEVRMR